MTAATASVTPATLAAFAARRRAAAAVEVPRLAYSTTTGEARRPVAANFDPEGAFSGVWDLIEEDPYCFVCGRCTDHVGEHEALVEAGLATYSRGPVHRTAQWEDTRAREISEREYQEYLAQIG